MPAKTLQIEQARAERELEKKYTLTDVMTESWKSYSGAGSLISMELDKTDGSEKIDVDDEKNKDFIKEVLKTVPAQYHQEILNETDTKQSMFDLAERYQEQAKRDEIIMSHGIGGALLGGLFATVTDPIAWTGVGIAGKVTTAPKFLKMTRMQRAFAGGMVDVTATTAPVELLVAQNDPTYSSEDAMWAVGTSFLAGAAAGGLLNPDVKREVAKVVKRQEIQAAKAFIDKTEGVEASESLKKAEESTRQVKTTTKDIFEADAPDIAPEHYADVSMASQVFRSKVPSIRKLMNSLIPDELNKGQGENSLEWVEYKNEQILTELERGRQSSLRNYFMEQTGKRRGSQALEDEYQMKLYIARETGKPSGSPVIDAEAARTNAFMKDMLAMEKNSLFDEGIEGAGVKGAEDIPEVDNYIQRRWDVGKMKPEQGEVIINTLAEKINDLHYRKEGELFDPAWMKTEGGKRSLKLAELFYDKLTVGATLKSLDPVRLLSLDSIDQIKKQLNDWDVDSSTIQDIVKEMEHIEMLKPSDKGRAQFHKRRLQIDVTQPSRTTGRAPIEWLNTDPHALDASRIRNGLGRVALARQGITDVGTDLPKILADITREARQPDIEIDIASREFQSQLNLIQKSVDMILGRPMGTGSEGEQLMRIGSKAAYSAFGGMMGIAQLADMGNQVSYLGTNVLLANLKAFKANIKRAVKGGEEADDLFDECSYFVGSLADSAFTHRVTLKQDEFENATSKGLNRVENFLDKANRVTSFMSGINFLNDGMQRATVNMGIDHFVRFANGAKSKFNQGLLDELGVTEKEWQSIKGNILKHAEFDGKRTQKAGIENWDREARATFGRVMYKFTRNVVTEPYRTSLPSWMNTPIGKFIGTFRTHMFAAWPKVFLKNIKMIREGDIKRFMHFANMTAFGALSYMANEIISRKEEDRRFAIEDIAKGSFQRASYSSFMTMGIDQINYIATGENMFNYRTTGLGGDFITGAAPYGLYTKGKAAIEGGLRAVVDENYQYSQQDFRNAKGALVFGNMIGVSQLLQMGAEQLPKYSEEK
ncbi:hypothetical protein [Vibrio panuliri]|uniref:Large polyvalent protein associated domain-containing protein n=1 Tax=Vibrio panuliri TaxID=1381081 RepID=A0ABX3FFH0_9VIBR|nr:hypothetical protein [Vibrio panuliri]KAB1460894.1 hypothetical protein F7O85_00525 [Vibrio panuliri]OLQ91647.1 hypothetical protein BIY20_09600 [Vibrio panuliri]